MTITMKLTFILLTLLILTGTTTFGQNNELKKEQIQSIQKLINIFKTKNKTKIADLISYPLMREYPLKDVKNKNDFIQRFDDIFDKEFVDKVGNSKMKHWSEVGWRGIMLYDGALWIDDKANIMTVNYQSAKEKELLVNAIKADKNQLPKALQDYEKPIYLFYTKNYKIRIDETKEGIYRYASWKFKNVKSDPDIIIPNGNREFQGSGGNHVITFNNDGYTYTVSINILGTVGTSNATLEVSKHNKTLLTEDGKIKRN
jgi:hypothetical protein